MDLAIKARWRSAVFRLRGHRATLELLFQDPPAPVRWEKVKALLTACGVKQRPGPGDGTFLEFDGNLTEVLTPEGETPRPVMGKTKEFLKKSKITPDNIRQFLGAMP